MSLYMTAPPSYDGPNFQAPSSSSLPAYSPRRNAQSGSRGSTTHVYTLGDTDSKRKTRATLKLFSSASTSASLPIFLEGDKITGELTVSIPTGEKLASVVVLVRGEITVGQHRFASPSQHMDKLYFLDLSVPLWSKSAGGPSFSGDHRWPFSIHLPKDVALPDPRQPTVARTFALPHSFMERNIRVSVSYRLHVRLNSSRMFHQDLELQTTFVYMPALRPDSPSMLRQIAYQHSNPIPGPELDAEGWYTFPAVSLKGTVFNARKVQVQGVLSLAKPLSYTRGSTIPCYLTYHCRDLQALDLLCTPTATNFCLLRQVVCMPLSTTTGGFPLSTNDTEECGRAVWWPVSRGDGSQRQDMRTLEGEIHLPKTLKPSSEISHFSLKYFVVMMPSEAVGFSAAKAEPLLRHEVNITTIFPRGPKPRSYAPRS